MFTEPYSGRQGYQSTRGQLVTRSSRHTVNSSSQASTVQSYGWAMLNYAGKEGEAGD